MKRDLEPGRRRYEHFPMRGVDAGIPPENMAFQSALTAEIAVPGTYTTNPPVPEAAQNAAVDVEQPEALTSVSVVPGPNTNRPKPRAGNEIVPDVLGLSPTYVNALGSVPEPPSGFVTVIETVPGGCGGVKTSITFPITFPLRPGTPSKYTVAPAMKPEPVRVTRVSPPVPPCEGDEERIVGGDAATAGVQCPSTVPVSTTASRAAPTRISLLSVLRNNATSEHFV
jgi:hypothetical protein